MKLLHIDSSILGTLSVSRQVSAAIVERLRVVAPALEVTYRDLAAAPLAHLLPSRLPGDHPGAAALDDLSDRSTLDERAASDTALAEFLAADVVVIGAPMYNFTLPSQLKAWLDRILVPGKTFQYGPEGVQGLASAKRVIVAISRGALYGAGTPYATAEHLETYLRAVFGFIGVTDFETIVAEGIRTGPEKRGEAVEMALRAANALQAA